MLRTKTSLFLRCMLSVTLLVTEITSFDNLPQISYKDLQKYLNNQKSSPKLIEKLKDSGSKYSAFVISDLDEIYAQAVTNFQSIAASCITTLRNDDQTFKLDLTDDLYRITFATISKKYPECFYHSVMSETFDQIDYLMSMLVEDIVGRELDYLVNGEIYSLSEAPIKDHIHVYFNNMTISKNEKTATRTQRNKFKRDNHMVPFHVDNGLYLMVSPFSNHGIDVQMSDGEIVSTSNIRGTSIIILFGRGLTEWMLQSSSKDRKMFFPAPHAVPTFGSTHTLNRSVFARMKVAPDSAIPYTNYYDYSDKPKQMRTFRTVFMGEDLEKTIYPRNRKNYNQLCLIGLDDEQATPNSRWKRNGNDWKNKMKEKCDEGEAFCWMNCLPLDPKCPSVSESHCVDENTKDPCFDDSMDTDCHWECKPEPSTTQKPNTTTKNHASTSTGRSTLTTESPELPFCRSGSFSTDMNMKGFFSTRQESKPCIILFFEAWELDSRLKFGLGCVGVIFLGIMVEACIAIRRKITSPSKRGMKMIVDSRYLISENDFLVVIYS